MNRKTKFLKTVLLLVCVLVGTFTSGAYDFVVDGIYYNKNGNEATVTFKTTSYNTYSGDVIIPPTVTYDGVAYTVSAIGDNAFNRSTGLTNVDIPNSIISIGNNAFYGCNSLTSVTVPNSVTDLGDYAFFQCSGLTSIDISNSLTSIGNYVFYYCTRLTSVNLPDSVAYIGSNAFRGCKGLTNFSLPKSLIGIGTNAFEGCSGLTNLSIPNSVTEIGAYAFQNCEGLTNLNIGQSVRTLGAYAFRNCKGLTSLSIPNSVTSIGTYAFSTCNNIINLDLGNSVITIGDYAFYNCSNITSVTIPNSVTSIGINAFRACNNLTYLIIGNSVVNIGAFAFCGTGLTKVIIPKTVSTFGNGVFSDCTNLILLCFNAENCQDFTSSSTSSVFYKCPLESIIIGDEVKSIPAYLTLGTTKTTLKTLIIGNSVTSIGSYAFQSCTGLTSLTLPNSLSSIGSNAFASCTNLKTIFISGEGEWKAGTLPMNSSIKTLYIGSGITLLSDMRVNPTDIYCYAAVPPTCHANAFTGYTGKLHVPSSSYATYCFALTWENFTDIEAGAVEPTTIRLNKASLEMAPIEQQTLTAAVQPSGAYPNAPIIWWTTDPNVAIVENGIVTAVAPGECDVIASCYPVRAVCHVTVDDTSSHIVITLDQHEAEVKVNHMITLIPTMTPEETELVVTSSDPTVAGARIVNGSVRIVGIHVGETTITVASADGTAQPATCLVKVFTDPGDVNCDGAFSIGDVTALISVLLSGEGVDNPYADVNGDGRVSIGDVTELINILLTSN